MVSSRKNQDDMRPPYPDPRSFEFILYERIEDGPAKSLILQERHIYYTGRGEQPAYMEEDRQVDVDPTLVGSATNDTRVQYCYNHNCEQWQEFLKRCKDFKLPKDGNADEFTKRLNSYFKQVGGRFHKWFVQNGFPLPANISAPNGSPGQRNKIPVKRLKLTPNEKEMLHERIVGEVDGFIDGGRGSQEEAFNSLASDSERKFGYILTKGQIEGRYKRHRKEFKK